MKPTKKQKELGKEWGWGKFEIEHGYGLFEADYGLLVINRIDDMGTFESDYNAIRQAKKDGFTFLHGNILDLPVNKLIIEEKGIEEEWL